MAQQQSIDQMQQQAYVPPDDCLENAYPCIMHSVGVCDEYPQLKYPHRQQNPYDCSLEAGN